MLEYFIITLWIEFNDKLYVTYDTSLRSNCKQAYHYHKKRLKNTNQTLVALKCTNTNEFKLNKRILDGTEIYKKDTRPVKQDLPIYSRG